MKTGNISTIYPNPVQNILHIHNAPQDVYVRIYNIQGSCVMQTIGNTIDISILPSGVYTIIAAWQTKRFIKE